MGDSLTPETVTAIRAALREGLDVGIVAHDVPTVHRLLLDLANGNLHDLVEAVTTESEPAPTRGDPWAWDRVRTTADTCTGGTLYAMDVTGARGMSLGLVVAYHLTDAERADVAPTIVPTGGDLISEPAPPAPTTSDRLNAVTHTTAAALEALAPAARGALAAIRRAWATGSTDPAAPANYQRSTR